MAVSIVLLFVVFVTSTVSGIFGMAGGLMLMGALALVMPAAAAMVTHGVVQMTANGARAGVHFKHIQWPILALFALGAAAAGGLLTLFAVTLSKPWLYLMLGLTPGLVWLPKDRLRLDAARPLDAAVCGLAVTGLNATAGVAGPLLDVFFVRTALGRHAIVATKAATQVLSHAVKVAFYGAPLFMLAPVPGLPPWQFFVAAAPLTLAGAMLGGRILAAMSDTRFLAATRLIVTALGVIYLAHAAALFAQG